MLFLASIIGVFTESGIRRRIKAIFFKSKALIDRITISCYQLIPSNNDVFVAEAFKMKPNIGKSSIDIFFVFEERTSKFQDARVSIIIHIISIVS